jgi:ribosome maturation factor RimP
MTRQELADLVRPSLEGEGYELVECSVSRTARSQTFRIAIDREGGVPISGCERASRLIGGLLDANPALRGAYHLEVSSAGMNRPVWSPDHFRRFREERVRIELADPAAAPRVLLGRIGPVDEREVVLLLDGGEERRVAFVAVRRANLQIDPWKKRPHPTAEASAGSPADGGGGPKDGPEPDPGGTGPPR